VKMRSGHTFVAKLRQAGRGFLLQLVDWPETDRFRGAGLSAGGGQTLLEPVIAEGTFLGGAVVFAHMNDAEGTSRHAIAAAVASRAVDEDGVGLRAQDRAGRG